MNDQTVPLHVVSGAADADAIVRRCAAAGWKAHRGFALLEPAWDLAERRLLAHGAVTDDHTASQAVLAAARGAGIVAVAAGQIALALAADLRRVGPLGVTPGKEAPADGLDLDAEQRALLARLAGGSTIAAAAEAEFVSLRTANRRIAAARGALGVKTTREAVMLYIKHARD
ncbi:LuxR family transcriptional regulator [Glycomyces buryatensis]|uniref:LuxR family transcriptional regulator n=1 Tax=Glycomyces buryatensis TaxID=2570927 RepID=A0A4V4HQE1_9ACTN|nr:LuxR family transcriptional regulator [Glycomyces buryatensis]THV33466.1 LuxR family transcriptional regulator [Glycomyces buryatensis]